MSFAEAATLPYAAVIGGQVSMVGVLAAGGLPSHMDLFLSFPRFQPITTGSRLDLEDVRATVAQHGLRPVIDSRFAFDDARSAWMRFVARDLFGKVVITQDA